MLSPFNFYKTFYSETVKVNGGWLAVGSKFSSAQLIAPYRMKHLFSKLPVAWLPTADSWVPPQQLPSTRGDSLTQGDNPHPMLMMWDTKTKLYLNSEQLQRINVALNLLVNSAEVFIASSSWLNISVCQMASHILLSSVGLNGPA